jgi:hypothetical protein
MTGEIARASDCDDATPRGLVGEVVRVRGKKQWDAGGDVLER